ncbi:MAG TPA: penicillin-insensitive murein endopeptidase [Polyangiaceae bacterium]
MRPPAILLALALALACGAAASGLSAARPPYTGAAPTLAPVQTRAVERDGVTLAVGEPVAATAPNALSAREPPLLLDTLNDTEIARRLASDPGSLGAMSIGGPNHGALFNAAQLPDGTLWRVVEPDRAWGAPEALASIETAIERVHAEFPDSPPLYVGHLSARHGGYLRPHRSHQSGRDVDLGYFYLGGPGWYARASAKNLDVVRTWALVKAFASDPNVEAIFMDRSVQRLLSDHAEANGERAEWLFEGSHRGGEHLVRHEWGHLTHLHVRFRCTEAMLAGERSEKELLLARLIPPNAYHAPRRH